MRTAGYLRAPFALGSFSAQIPKVRLLTIWATLAQNTLAIDLTYPYVPLSSTKLVPEFLRVLERGASIA